MSVHQQQSGQQQLGPHLGRVDFLAPFDWGLAFALRHTAAIFQISLFPALLKVFLRYVEYFRPLSPRDAFLIIILDLGAKTWLLVTIMLLCIVSMQGIRAGIWSIGRRALLSMPKVVMSCVVLLVIVAAFFLAPWMYIFVLFLLWAPIFCAGEITAKSFREDSDVDEIFDDEDVVRSEERLKARRIRYFADKPIWDFGFSRSIHFAANRRNFIVTVQLALLFLVALTLPLAAIVTLAGYYHGFLWVIVESFFSYFAFGLVLAVACATFLKMLPNEAVDEIGIVNGFPPGQILSRPLKFHGRIFPFFLLALLGGVATKATIDYIIVNNTKPPTLVAHVENIEVTKQQFVVILQLEDRRNLLRWLSPLSFQLQLISDQTAAGPEKKELAANAVPDAEIGNSKPQKKEGQLLEPERAMPYALDGTPLSEENFVPYAKPLRLVLYFSNPLKEAETKGRYVLHYVPVIGESEPFLEGHFGE